METEKKNSILGIIIKAVIFGMPAIAFSFASIYQVGQTILKFGKFITIGYIPWLYIGKEVMLCFTMFAFSFLLWKIIFGRSLKIISGFQATAIFISFAILNAVVLFFNDMRVLDFEHVKYPPYIDEMPIKVLYEEQNCDYSYDKIYLEGYMNFTNSKFRPSKRIDIVYNENMTDRYRIEVKYRGEDSELHVIHYSHKEAEGQYSDSISVYTKKYRRELTEEQVRYMYKNKVDIEYAPNLAIEKVTIYTAYPEKIDISNIHVN